MNMNLRRAYMQTTIGLIVTDISVTLLEVQGRDPKVADISEISSSNYNQKNFIQKFQKFLVLGRRYNSGSALIS